MSNQSELISHMSSKDTKLSTHNKLRKSQQPRTCSVSLLLQPFKIKDHIICDHLKLGLFKFDSELANFLFKSISITMGRPPTRASGVKALQAIKESSGVGRTKV